MANDKNSNSKNVEGFITIILGLVERWNEIWRVDRKHPIVPKYEPDKEEEAECKMDVVFVSILPPWIFIIVVIINHDRFGKQLPHPGGVIKQKGHLYVVETKKVNTQSHWL